LAAKRNLSQKKWQHKEMYPIPDFQLLFNTF
jgi:hypothetical protein